MSFSFKTPANQKGFAGKIMVNMMNTGHAALAEWGLTHIKIRDDDFCLDIGCGGGANPQTPFWGKSSNGHITGVDYSEVSVQKSKKTQSGSNSGRPMRSFARQCYESAVFRKHFSLGNCL